MGAWRSEFQAPGPIHPAGGTDRPALPLSAIEAGTTVARQRLLRGIAEAWLKGHPETYRRRRRSGGT